MELTRTLRSSDLPKPLAGVAGGFGDVDLPGAVVEGFEDRGMEGFAGRISAGGVAAHRGGQLRQILHERKGSTLANALDKRTGLANTIGMTTTMLGSIQWHSAWPIAHYSNTAARCGHCGGTIRLTTRDEWLHNNNSPVCKDAR